MINASTYKTVVPVAFFCLTLIGQAFAQSTCSQTNNRMGVFANVSASGPASVGSPVTACTVINALESIDSTTAFFVEAPQGDAVLEVFYVGEPKYNMLGNFGYGGNLFPRRVFDNWVDNLTTSDTRLLETKLRLPGKVTDAAAMFTSDYNYYEAVRYATNGYMTSSNYTFGVCASGYPKSGSSWVNVSITNLGPSKSNYCYAKSGVYFEK